MANWKAGGAIFVILLLGYLFAFSGIFKEYLSEETTLPAMIIGFIVILIISGLVATKT